ncbi:hypothetical protein AB0M28_39190 [Streptomyces sp. NPDC051940]|uniref:hypothetical protein n=1 Tax=Streptomyces sp. NPDC051940 TaxID=3155675 RepID=UPI00342430E6
MRRALLAAAGAVLTVTLLAGCGPDGGGDAGSPQDVSPSELARMQKLVDGAEGAAGQADKDAAAED